MKVTKVWPFGGVGVACEGVKRSVGVQDAKHSFYFVAAPPHAALDCTNPRFLNRPCPATIRGRSNESVAPLFHEVTTRCRHQ